MPRIDLDILNQKQTPAFYASSLATRPAYGFVGRIFIDSDSPSTGLYRDTGSAWVSIATPGSATPTLQAVTTAGSSTDVGITVTTNGIGIGTAIPGANLLDIHGTQGVLAQLENTTTQNSLLSFRNQGAGAWSVGNSYNAGANDFIIYDAVSFSNRLTIKNNGNVLINSSTDSGEKLQITGSSKFTGAITQSSNNTTILGNGLQFDNGSGTRIIAGSTITYQVNSSSTQHIFTNASTKPNILIEINAGATAYTLTSSTASILKLDGRMAITSNSTANINAIYIVPTDIGGTGTYTGITCGLNIELPVSSGTGTIRAIQTNRGDILLNTTSGNTLIGTTTDNGKKLQVNGTITTAGFAASGEVLSVSATLSEQYYHVFTGAVGQTLTLLSPSSNNLQYVIINNSANTVTIAAAASTNIVNTVGSSVATITLIANQRVFIIADGNNKYYQIF